MILPQCCDDSLENFPVTPVVCRVRVYVSVRVSVCRVTVRLRDRVRVKVRVLVRVRVRVMILPHRCEDSLATFPVTPFVWLGLG